MRMIFRLEQNDFPICFKRKTTNLEKEGKTPLKRPQNTAFYSLFPGIGHTDGSCFCRFSAYRNTKKADKRPLFPTCILSDSSFRISHYRKSNPTLRRSARYTVRQSVPAPPRTSRRKADGPSSDRRCLHPSLPYNRPRATNPAPHGTYGCSDL